PLAQSGAAEYLSGPAASMPRPASRQHWGYSSVGRAREWHSRGQRFDPAQLHQSSPRSGGDCHVEARKREDGPPWFRAASTWQARLSIQTHEIRLSPPEHQYAGALLRRHHRRLAETDKGAQFGASLSTPRSTSPGG